MKALVGLPKLDERGDDISQRLAEMGLEIDGDLDEELYSVEVPLGWFLQWHTDWPIEKGFLKDKSQEIVAVWVKEYQSYGQKLKAQYTEFPEISSE